MEENLLFITGDKKVEIFTRGGDIIMFNPKDHEEIRVNLDEVISITTFK